MNRAIPIIIAILLAGCAPALQNVHDEVYSRYIPAPDIKVAQWDNGMFRGNCAAFAKVMLSRATEQGMDADYVVVWRNEGDVLTGYVMIWHAVVISGGFVSDNNFRWVYPEHEFWERWNDETH